MRTASELQPFYKALGYVIAVHVLCLLALSVCRLIVLFSNLPSEGIDWALLPTAMLIGVKFDNLIACYMSALPLIFVPVFSLCTLHHHAYASWQSHVVKGVMWYYGVVYAILLFIGVADARYYQFFENHLNISVTAWFGFVGDTAGLVFQDKGNMVYLGIAVLVIVCYLLGLRLLSKQYMKSLAL